MNSAIKPHKSLPSFSKRLMLWLCVFAIFPSLLTLSFAFYGFSQAIDAEVNQEYLSAHRTELKYLEQWIIDQELLSEQINDELRDDFVLNAHNLSSEYNLSHLVKFASEKDDTLLGAYLESEGKVTTLYRRDGSAAISSEAFFAISSSKFWSVNKSRNEIVLVSAVMDERETSRIALVYNLANLKFLADRKENSFSEKIRVLFQDNHFFGEQSLSLVEYRAFVKSAINTSSTSFDIVNGKAIAATEIEFGRENFVFVSIFDYQNIINSKRELLLFYLGVCVFSVIAIFLIAKLVVARLNKPLLAFTEWVELVGKGDDKELHAIFDVAELRKVADQFNLLLKQRERSKQELDASLIREQRAFEQAKQIRNALDSHAIVAITDVKGNIIFANDKFSTISGYQTEELIGENHRLLNSGYHPTEFFINMYRQIARGNVWRAEICNRRKDGELYWVDTTIYPVLGLNKKPESYIAIRTDITEIRLSKERLSEQAQLLKSAQKLARIGHYSLNVHTNIWESSEELDAIFGINKTYIKTTSSWLDLVVSEDKEKLLDYIKFDFFKKRKKFDFSYRINRKSDSEVRWVHAIGDILLDENNRVSKVFGIVQDITEQRMHEEVRREIYEATDAKFQITSVLNESGTLDERLEKTLNVIFSIEGLNVQTKGGIFRYDNESQCLKLCHYQGEFSEQFLADEETVNLGDCLCGRAAESGEILISDNCETDHRHEHRWDDMKPHGHYIVPLIESQKEGLLGVMFLYTDINPSRSEIRLNLLKDIGDLISLAIVRDRAKEELIRAQAQAEDNNRIKSEFLASMSHEIRTPMNGIMGMFELLMNQGLTEKQRHYASLGMSSAQSLLAIINDILDFSKIESGKLILENIEFDVISLLSEIVESYGYQAQNKNIELILDVKDCHLRRLYGDPGRIRQVVNNLISNAIKFTEQGEVVLYASSERKNGYGLLSFEVSDTGIGIAEEKQQSLFSSFTQADTSTTRVYGGTGLGLAIVKQLVELMHGKVELKSRFGVGSSFTVELQLGAKGNDDQLSLGVDLRNTSILLVDPNKRLVDATAEQLKRWGAKVSAVSSGEQVIRQLANSAVDIVIVNQSLPDIDVTELVKSEQIEKTIAQPSWVVMTSLATRGDNHFVDNNNFDYVFAKPVTPPDLWAMFGELLKISTPLKSQPIVGSRDRERITSDEASSIAGLKILVAEDNKVNQVLILALLKKHGIQASLAQDGQEVLETLHSGNAFDLVLMDCQMPQIDGYEATRKIRAGEAGREVKDIPIVALTANAMKGDREKCIASGMDDYLTKPIQQDALVQALQRWALVKVQSRQR